MQSKLIKKSVKPKKREIFGKIPVSYTFLTAVGLFFSKQYDFRNINKYNKTTNFVRKPFISQPLNTITFNGSQRLHQVIPQGEKNDVCQA